MQKARVTPGFFAFSTYGTAELLKANEYALSIFPEAWNFILGRKYRMQKILLIIGLLAQCFVVYAQFSDSTSHYINYTSTGTINKTNEGNSYVLNNNLRFSISKKQVSFNNTNSWIYGEQLNRLSNNDFASIVDFNIYNRKRLRDLYYWGLGNYESNFSLKIHHRLQAGVGVGYNIIEKENLEFIVSNGILYEKSDLYKNAESATAGNDYETLRNSFRIKFKWVIRNSVVLEGFDFIQHSLEDRKDYIVKSQTNISVKLREWLRITTSITYNKQTRTERENLLINYGLTFEKYF